MKRERHNFKRTNVRNVVYVFNTLRYDQVVLYVGRYLHTAIQEPSENIYNDDLRDEYFKFVYFKQRMYKL